MKRGLLNKVTTLLTSISMIAGGFSGTALTVHADETIAPIAGGQAVFEKYLVLDEDANVPNETFSFEISAGTAQNATGSTSAVYAGDDKSITVNSTGDTAKSVIENITVSDATFTADDTAYDSVQAQPDSVSVQNEDTVGTKNNDAVTLEDGQKYARADVTVDFSKISFSEPGIYRYVITEAAAATDENTAHGITNDEDVTRTLDVYVLSDDDALSIGGYVLHNGDGSTVSSDGSGTTDKASGFVNQYATHSLTVSKTVSGNQGNRNKYFKFTVTISGAVPGTKYNVDLTGAEQTTSVTFENTTAHSNPATITVGEDGTISQEFWLKHGQQIVINGLADGTKYQVVEDPEDYTASYETTTESGAEEIIASGESGGVSYKVTSDGTLTFYPTNGVEGTFDNHPFNTTAKALSNQSFANSIRTIKFDGICHGSTSMDYYWLSSFSNLESVDVTGFDTSNTTDLGGMFESDRKLTTLDLSSMNVSNITNLGCFFYQCRSLTSVDLSGWDLTNLQLDYGFDDMNEYMAFMSCSSLQTVYLKGCNEVTYNKIQYLLDVAFASAAQNNQYPVSNHQTQVTIITE